MTAISSNLYQDHRGTLAFIPMDVLDRHWQNITISSNPAKHTFRGMHRQLRLGQEKFVQVIQGSIIDFTYNKFTDEANMQKLNKGESYYIDEDLHHGFLTLEPNTIVLYLTSEEYCKDQEIINWSDIPYISDHVMRQTQGLLIISDKDKDAKGIHC